MTITITVADNLRQTEQNQRNAETAVARSAALAWTLLPDPGKETPEWKGSDTLAWWRCELCGWEGWRFYSHIGRNKPVKRHPGSCVPITERPYDGQPIPREQPVTYPFSAHARAAAWLALRDARRHPETDPEGAAFWRAALGVSHREYRDRVLLAVGRDERDAIKRARLRGYELPPGTHDEVMADLKKDCMTSWVHTPYGLALLGDG